MTTQQKALEKVKGNNKPENKPVSVPKTMRGLKSNDIRGILELYKGQIAQAIPKHLTPERIIQTATTLIARTPELASCSSESLLGAVLQCSILGFEPITALGQCYFVPFRNKKTGQTEVNFLIGYRGLIDLAMRSGRVKTIYSEVVFENDFFEYELGLNPKLVHVPAESARGKMKGVYAVMKLTNGGESFVYLSKTDIEQIKKLSQAGGSKFSPWNSDSELVIAEMWKKSAIRRLLKYSPVSIEVREIHTDEAIIKPEAFNRGEVDLNKIEEIPLEMAEDNDNNSGEPDPNVTEQGAPVANDPALFQGE